MTIMTMAMISRMVMIQPSGVFLSPICPLRMPLWWSSAWKQCQSWQWLILIMNIFWSRVKKRIFHVQGDRKGWPNTIFVKIFLSNIFVRVDPLQCLYSFFSQIYSDISLYRYQYECHTLHLTIKCFVEVQMITMVILGWSSDAFLPCNGPHQRVIHNRKSSGGEITFLSFTESRVCWSVPGCLGFFPWRFSYPTFSHNVSSLWSRSTERQ